MTEIAYETTGEYVRAYVEGKISYSVAHRRLVREGRSNAAATNILNWAKRLAEWKRRNAADAGNEAARRYPDNASQERGASDAGPTGA
jgi:hypothetical protein